ncbi:ABC transporter ATP-binding protein [Brucella gallinifaecis]|uniref:ATP-binding cassette domain-containing protein n=1 Tax=Brucella gallinifaecis TaxID=215590 RepID=A0A502BL42_9HYPH|nr:ATP-binding cassette domain-containing protein [Brucella gallinifaecis]TPF74670.1 ATP-binding cassette domain-containing protein [Brucella gallinifaecis]
MPYDTSICDNYLAVENIAKSFGTYDVLKHIQLHVQEQEFVCLLGPSGCGKSTLLRIIAGLETSSQGQLFKKGQNINKLDPADRRFGILFQSYALFPNLTVEQNVGYGLRGRNWNSTNRQKRVIELLELVGLQAALKKYPAQLSGGQQQRVALARALAPSPDLLLLDEPLSALDAQIRSKLRVELKNLQKFIGITTIMVTHDQEEALTMADRIAIMNEGRIEQYGTPHELYNAPKTLFVAQFVGSMNAFSGVCLPDQTIELGGQKGRHATFNTAAGKADICIRPEFVVINPLDTDDTFIFEATVAATEFLGTMVRVYLQCPKLGRELVRVDCHAGMGPTVKEGDAVRFGLPFSRLHIYPTGDLA